MKKSELKEILRPLIKECIKEIIFEEGSLSTIISEVIRGTSGLKPIVERREPKSNKLKQEQRRKIMEEQKQKRKKMLDSIGKDAYNGVNLFEGTTPAPAAATTQGQGPLDGVDPSDPGVDISSIFSGQSSNIWKKLSGK
jgi:hypothetical protein|tara:strand:- start:401 stop:817 length:417 start_codon:yes stop_codon:yes gene_type:complete